MADFGKLNFSVSLNPTSAFPLDARCYFESLEAAQAAALTAEEAGSTNTSYYIGQKLLVVANNEAKWYTIQPDKTLKVEGEGGSSGTGVASSPAIIDVAVLPETDINENAFYRVLTAEYYYNFTPQTNYFCYIVDTLPEIGEPVTDAMLTELRTYYAIDTGENSGYLTSELGAALGGLPAGWYPAASLFQAVGVDYGGIIRSLYEPLYIKTMYLFLHTIVKYRNDGVWHDVQGIGARGIGKAAEIFNSLNNIASGVCSHAEGFSSEASGENSHAEGFYTIASGKNSHAEGNGSRAVGLSQHVHGEYNIRDPEYNADKPDIRAKYAHIVGNGTESMRSNAHTLDWEGNAWFQGNVYVGGTGQDDEAAVKLVTEKELEEAVRNVGGAGTGGASSIIDVGELPETDIRDDLFYRVITAVACIGGNSLDADGLMTLDNWVGHVVETLPEVGNAAVNSLEAGLFSAHIEYYYAIDTDIASCYMTSELAQQFGVSIGWYTLEAALFSLGVQFGGVVKSPLEVRDNGCPYILLRSTVKYQNNGELKTLDSVIWEGTGNGSIRINSVNNIASGKYSNAEGDRTTASGRNSHAEGDHTTASGYNSHAEGEYTIASGDFSHAEGYFTIASSRNQHVEGKYNISDPIGDRFSLGKYIKIVGNGDGDNRSNAYTLDWNGVAWYQGRPQFGGTAQDDGAQTVMANGDREIVLKSPNGSLWGITVYDDGTLTATAKS